MIANDDELQGTRARIAYFEDLLAQMRVAAPAELFPSMASGYRAEIEIMHREVLEYLTPPCQSTAPGRGRLSRARQTAPNAKGYRDLCGVAKVPLLFFCCFLPDPPSGGAQQHGNWHWVRTRGRSI